MIDTTMLLLYDPYSKLYIYKYKYIYTAMFRCEVNSHQQEYNWVNSCVTRTDLV